MPRYFFNTHVAGDVIDDDERLEVAERGADGVHGLAQRGARGQVEGYRRRRELAHMADDQRRRALVDARDRDLAPAISATGITVGVADTIMTDDDVAEAVVVAPEATPKPAPEP